MQARGIASTAVVVGGGQASSSATEPRIPSPGGSTPGKASQTYIPLTVAERARAAAAATGAHSAMTDNGVSHRVYSAWRYHWKVFSAREQDMDTAAAMRARLCIRV